MQVAQSYRGHTAAHLPIQGEKSSYGAINRVPPSCAPELLKQMDGGATCPSQISPGCARGGKVLVGMGCGPASSGEGIEPGKERQVSAVGARSGWARRCAGLGGMGGLVMR